jgi:antitoxin CptB
MTRTTRSADTLDPRRRKLLFRSWHRGIREMDLILGGFADAQIDSLTDAELDQYEELLEIQDADLLSWVTGEQPVPATHRALMTRIAAGKAAVTI